MSKFNKKNQTQQVINYAGGRAFSLDEKTEFATIILTSFLTDQYYRSQEETIERINDLINRIYDKKFVAKTAIFARNEFGMRSITHLIASILAKTVKGESWTKNFYERVVRRVDDITEILSAYGKKPIPNSLKKGLRQAFNKFDEYQLAKYQAKGKIMSLVDAVNLLHPKPTEKNKEALRKLIKGELKSFNTWEVEMTKTYGDDEKKRQVWERLIKERKIGYFALLRNLRNIIEQAPHMVDEAVELLTNQNLISQSLVLPFRFLTAYNEIRQLSGQEVRKVLIALNKAADISLKNVPTFEGETLVAIDISGSMEGRQSEIASLFGAILAKSNNADVLLFNDEAYYQSINPLDSVLTIAETLKESGGGTNFHAIFEELNKPYDRIIILSDMQGWIGGNAPTTTFEEYKRRVGANPKIYSFDLAGYGTIQLPQPNIYLLAGFSEKVFNIMKLLEKDKEALVNEIEKIDL